MGRRDGEPNTCRALREPPKPGKNAKLFELRNAGQSIAGQRAARFSYRRHQDRTHLTACPKIHPLWRRNARTRLRDREVARGASGAGVGSWFEGQINQRPRCRDVGGSRGLQSWRAQDGAVVAERDPWLGKELWDHDAQVAASRRQHCGGRSHRAQGAARRPTCPRQRQARQRGILLHLELCRLAAARHLRRRCVPAAGSAAAVADSNRGQVAAHAEFHPNPADAARVRLFG